MNRTILPVAAAILLVANPAFAHLPPGEYGSFAAGFSHPLFGLDHILTMVAVGLWAGLQGGRAVWAVPTAFVSAMIAGFLLAMAGIDLPFVEPMILASVVVLGMLVALTVRLDTGLAMGIVAIFAVFHGHAHGGELGEAGALPFGLGFALATALLHGAGIGLGLLLSRNGIVTRGLGAATAAAGLWLTLG